MTRTALALACVLAAGTVSAGPSGSPPPDLTADVLVVDSTPAGIAAAVAASGGGRRVVLVTEDKHVGGMQTSGLGNTNAGQREVVGGLAREFHDRIRAYYVKKYGADSQQVKDCSDGFHFEPHVAERVCRRSFGVNLMASVPGVRNEPRRVGGREGNRVRAYHGIRLNGEGLKLLDRDPANDQLDIMRVAATVDANAVEHVPKA